MGARWVRTIIVSGLVMGAVASSGGLARGAVRPARASDTELDLPTTGAWLGATVQLDPKHTSPDRRTAWTDFETEIGRPLALDREFYNWDDQFPTADDAWSRDQGRRLVISWTPALPDGTYARWADIAAGVYDDLIDARAADLQAFGATVYFSFHPEPNNQPPVGPAPGTQQDFVAAYRHVHDRFRADGTTNVVYVLTLMSVTYRGGLADGWYPGDDVVDILGADGYNWYHCGGPWRTFASVFADFREYGLARAKPMFVLEYGSGEDPEVPGRKGQWLSDAATMVKDWPEIKGVMYFHSGRNANTTCSRWVDSSPSALAAFQAMGADPYFNPPQPDPPPTVTLRSDAPNPTIFATATFSFSSSGPVQGYTCGLDGAPPEACTSPIELAGLAQGEHEFVVQDLDAEGVAGAGARWTWRIDPLEVVVRDDLYSPASAYPGLGGHVAWSFRGAEDHSVTDSSGMGMFDSGVVGPGSTYDQLFFGAGTFAYRCTVHPDMTGTVKVAMSANLLDPGGDIALVWASEPAPEGWAFGVQVKRPGSSKWKGLQPATTDPGQLFSPDTGPGTYSFRSRVRNTSNGTFSKWSAAKAVTVAG